MQSQRCREEKDIFVTSPCFVNGLIFFCKSWFFVYLVARISELNSSAERSQAAYAMCNFFNFLVAAILTGTIAGLFIFCSSSSLLLTLLDLLTAPGWAVTEHNGIFALGSWRQCIWMGKAADNMDANFKLLVLSPRH